jgi:HEPN domain-containing protein
MNRSDFQELSQIRIEEAKALLDSGLYGGAYYLAGYAVECAVKACIARLTKEHDFPDKEVVNKSWTHKLSQLIDVAGLEKERSEKSRVDKEFELRWGVVKDWSEESRYWTRTGEKEARQLYEAITDPKFGVLLWLRHRW